MMLLNINLASPHLHLTSLFTYFLLECDIQLCPIIGTLRINNLEISDEYHGHFKNKNEIKIEHFKPTLLVVFLIPTVMCVALGCVTLVEVCGVVIG